jgi:hypothetical protein
MAATAKANLLRRWLAFVRVLEAKTEPGVLTQLDETIVNLITEVWANTDGRPENERAAAELLEVISDMDSRAAAAALEALEA